MRSTMVVCDRVMDGLVASEGHRVVICWAKTKVGAAYRANGCKCVSSGLENKTPEGCALVRMVDRWFFETGGVGVRSDSAMVGVWANWSSRSSASG